MISKSPASLTYEYSPAWLGSSPFFGGGSLKWIARPSRDQLLGRRRTEADEPRVEQPLVGDGVEDRLLLVRGKGLAGSASTNAAHNAITENQEDRVMGASPSPLRRA